MHAWGRALATFLVSSAVAGIPALASYTNFESSQVHPIALTPSKGKLLVVNTPDALLEVFTVESDGSLTRFKSIPVGLEPVTVAARTDNEAWVVNSLSDTVSIVDLTLGATTKTLSVGEDPSDVVFANGRAFVCVAHEDAVKVYLLSNLDAAPTVVNLFGSRPRALAVSNAGDKVYATLLLSGDQTTSLNTGVIFGNDPHLDPLRLQQLGLNTVACNGSPPPYPPLPPGITRNPALTDPPGQPHTSLIVKWNIAAGQWRDEAGSNWNNCLAFRVPDHDLFAINTSPPFTVTTVDHLGTNMFEVSVNPGTGKVYLPNTDARNFVRFEHPLGVRGHAVDNFLTVVDPSAGNAVTKIDLNTHINRSSDPNTNLAERQASISQPGMMVWNTAGSFGYLTAIGSRKLFRVDSACTSGSCIFGSNRAAPVTVDVGEGPTGVALKESVGKLYVLNRFSNSVALVNVSPFAKAGEMALHDPSSSDVKQGRRFLYDGIDTSGHGDQACSSCHISGDRDGLSWDLGNPEGNLVPYHTPGDNVRFVQAAFGSAIECDPDQCAAHAGFDPQKGPMTTQTLRAMIEPLHWRGDRATMIDFDPAFVGLLGSKDIGPINGKPAGLTLPQMQLFRRFSLDIRFPPNPNRNVDDTVPNTVKTIPGHPLPGNPFVGEQVFRTGSTDLNGPCVTCHKDPFGTQGGQLGGINPGDPNTAKAALVNGDTVVSPHSDLKIPELRNLYEKFGPRFGSQTNPNDPPTDQKTSEGFIHDGSAPDLGTFLSGILFTLTSQQVKDISMFVLHFPTGTKPSVGKQVTVPGGAPPTGNPSQESLLSTMVTLGNLADPNRHCELVVSTPGPTRMRSYYLNGGAVSGGLWTTDVAGEAQLSTLALRTSATSPLNFLCAPLGSGVRLGVDRDEDSAFNGDDCAPADEGSFAAPVEVTNVAVTNPGPTHLAWTDEGPTVGVGARYDVVGGLLSVLHTSGLAAATSCVAGDVPVPQWDDTRAAPPAGNGWFYLERAENACGTGTFGPGTGSISGLTCTGP